MGFFLFVNTSASKGFRKPVCYAWGRKEKTNWTIERYRRWNWIAGSWGMTNLICTALLYLAYFYSKYKFDLSPTMKYPTKIWEKRWRNPVEFVSKNEFSLLSLLILLTAKPKKKVRHRRKEP